MKISEKSRIHLFIIVYLENDFKEIILLFTEKDCNIE
jgi:hypothetical protein